MKFHFITNFLEILGWDAVSGLGTPDLGKILSALPKYLKKKSFGNSKKTKIMAYPDITGLVSKKELQDYLARGNQ